jgi:CubicO group peptidase (beta-lactamase class C family)
VKPWLEMDRRTVLIGAGVLGMTSAWPGAAATHGSAAARARVENGLREPVVIAGASSRPWRIEERLSHYKVPGAGLAVIDGDRVAWAAGYGIAEQGRTAPVTRRTLFQFASLGKSLTAILALRLVREGKLGLDEDVNASLRSWRLPDSPLTEGRPVTLRALLSHTAGISTPGFEPYAAGEPLPSLLDDLNGRPPSRTPPVRVEARPGSRWDYSGGGYEIVRQLIEDVTARPFPELMRRKVLLPLAMTETFYEQPLAAAHFSRAASGHLADGSPMPGHWGVVPQLGAGGGWSTSSDLARLVIEIQRAAGGRASRLLTRAEATLMTTPVMNGYGLGLFIAGSDGTLQFNHTGHNTGFRCMMVGHPSTGQGAVVMTNGEARGGRLVFEIMRSIGDAYGWPDYRTIERQQVTVAPAILDSYVGTYRLENGPQFVVTRSGDTLWINAPPLGPDLLELHAQTENRFFVTVDPVFFTFVRNGEGRVTELLVEPPDTSFRASRIPT